MATVATGGSTGEPVTVLVDQDLQVRGYYDPVDEGVLDDLLRDAGLLCNRAAAEARATPSS